MYINERLQSLLLYTFCTVYPVRSQCDDANAAATAAASRYKPINSLSHLFTARVPCRFYDNDETRS